MGFCYVGDLIEKNIFMTQSFETLGLSERTLEALKKKGFEEPTAIQAQTIPLLLESTQDVIAQAQTGTGKTAAFGLVFADKLKAGKSKYPQAVVLAPTRELAVQVAEELNSLKGENKLRIIPIYGGQSWGMQRSHLMAGVDIVVGTPGRVMDHLEKGTLKLDKVDYFVLDEADEMLNMGFIDDIEKILSHAPEHRQLLLFSATMPKRISDLAKNYMKDPVMIKTQSDRIANNSVDQIYFETSHYNKFEVLCRIIDMEDEFYGIIFCRTKVDSDEVSKSLNNRGYKAEAFHGDITQDRREKILRDFKNKKTEVLVATDVAARGIDVNDLTHVINYGLPQNSESYVHRIGRTGRAGKDGKAITLITPSEYRKMRMFERHAKADIQKQDVPNASVMVDLKKKRILKDLEDILVSPEEVSRYKALAEDMFGDRDPQEVLAALLKLSFADSLDEKSYINMQVQQGRRQDDGQRGGRDRDQGRDRGASVAATDKFGNSRLFLTTGKADGATVQSILTMIEKDFGVSSRTIGDIDIMDSYSFISAPFADAEKIMDGYSKMKKNNPDVRIERASKGKQRGGSNRRSGRPSGGHRGGGKRR